MDIQNKFGELKTMGIIKSKNCQTTEFLFIWIFMIINLFESI